VFSSRKARVKFLLFLVGVAVFALFVLAALVLSGRFIAAFRQGADPASIFRGHSLIIPEVDEARWLAFDPSLDDLPKMAEQEEIIAAYWSAWEALGRAHLTGDISDLPTYWGGAAYSNALSSIDPDRDLTQTHSDHKLRLVFYSPDRSVIAFEDENFTITQATETTTLTLEATASVVMTNDQGVWRIRQMTLHYD